MYKLYGNISGLQQLAAEIEEKKIIEAIKECAEMTGIYDYLIILSENNTDMYYKKIRSKEDFLDYSESFIEQQSNEMLKQMSCTELKKEILNIKDNKILVKRKQL